MSALPQAASIPAAPPEVREIWYTRCPVPTASGLAQHFRWVHAAFAREGIAVHSLRDSDDPAVRESHFTHSLPASFREGGNIPAIWARSGGQDTVVVGITWVDEEQLILVAPDSDIRTLADIRGRRLGIPKNTARVVDFPRAQDLHGLVTGVRLAGLQPEDVQIVDIAGHDFQQRRIGAAGPGSIHQATADALLAGTVDVIYAKGAAGAWLVQERGLRPLLDINAHPDPFVRVNTGTPRPVTVNRDLAEQRPDIVARYLATLLRAAHWARSHPDEVTAAVAAETGTTADNVRRGYGPGLHQHFDVLLSDQYVEGLRRQTAFLREWGFLQGDFDYDAWIAREPLALAHQIVAREGPALPSA
ncbi:ABC transporter substrate-binding protein [Xylophilus sp.]|uniref:ABC transporter substrate-binding protein n=1 Tax=Xylophilus sp. TaxID=2653893 RepID=UPI0013BC404B|nr:ABC transporter substrate-binding protein [Xylophilus sp.]KAF1042766.1 MAG: 2'-hydroxybiphenyl-2-sulfinate desulfinase [Xylophilus sp.]